MNEMPRPSDATKQLFRDALPPDDRVAVKPMFGQLAAFVNDNMFGSIFGEDLVVRPDADGRAALLAEPGAAVFEPMAGRPMKEHVVLPRAWHADPARLRAWYQRALDAAVALPPKEKRPKRAK
jgi:TfoX/Sxy family transcriptional regulator of competence genes